MLIWNGLQNAHILVLFCRKICPIVNDVDRVINSFLRQFNSLYYKFNYLNLETLSFLFRSYSSSFYGAESWYYNLQIKTFRKISACYHAAVKRVCGLNVWDSNHAACQLVNVPIFKRFKHPIFFNEQRLSDS